MKNKILILTLLTLLILPISLAEEGCCALTNENKNCAYAEEFNCAPSYDFAPAASCPSTGFCKPGCCYDTITGIYDDNTFKSACQAQWNPVPCDNIDGSQKGCCVLGESTDFNTKRQCEVKTSTIGIENMDWQEVSESECHGLITSQEKGACVLENGECTLTTAENCNPTLSIFHEGHLCSSELVGSICTMTENTICKDGKVYFLDSCGEIGNIYDASRATDQIYWNEIISPENSCSNPTESKTCGNCDRLSSGSICSLALDDNFEVDMGDFYCKDTSCEFEGEHYKDKESWCVYDGKVGNGTDTVGSLHWLRYCDSGVVKTDSCKDYRAEICVQTNTEDDGQIFRKGECMENDWEGCLLIKDKAECENNPMCELRDVSINNFKLISCSPKYPGGFDLSFDDIEQRNRNDELCDLGSADCVVTYQKVLSGLKTKWVCKSNCDCRTSVFNDLMNDMCKSIGDCGGYINYQGKYTGDGFSMSGDTGALNLSDNKIAEYITLTNPIDFFIERAVFTTYSKLTGETGFSSIGYEASETLGISDEIWEATGSGKGRFRKGALLVLGHGGPVLIAKWMGIGKTKQQTVSFKCKPWTPPTEGYDCESCNDPNKPCTPYRCSSIGATCEIINKGTTEEMCYDTGSEDNQAPIITIQTDTISEGYKFDTSSSLVKITPMSGGCIDPYKNITFGINTDEPAYCKIGLEPSTFENLTWDLGSSSFVYNHTQSFITPHVGHVNIANPDLNWRGELNFYIKCKDGKGHENTNFYNLQMCINDAEDTASLGIKTFSPTSENLISFDATFEEITFSTVEISTCRWSINNVEYSLMENTAECTDFVCKTTLPITSAENTFYFRCMDQPWLEELNRSDERNADTTSKIYKLKKPAKKITIDSIKPNTDIISATDKQQIAIEVKTSSGGPKHICSYKLKEAGNFIEMLETRKTGTHSQPGLNLNAGKIKIYIKCTDETHDEATNSTEFEIIKSNMGLKINEIEDFISGTENNKVDLFLTTSGGGNEHICSYSVGNDAPREFEKTGDRGDQRQEVEVGTGEIIINVECHDEFQNTATIKTLFEITLDKLAPTISRIWQSGGNLHIITAGEDECKYSTKDCNFNWTKGISAGSGQEHEIEATRGETYYIKCQDKFGNTPSGCSIVAQAL
jgi:hypothetical protein